MRFSQRGRLVLLAVMIGFSSLSFADSAPAKTALEYRALGFREQHEGDFEKALIYYLKALQIQPDLAAVHNDLGIVYEELGDWREAEKSYLTAVEIDPNYVQAYSNLALLYESRKDREMAAEYWRKRLELGSLEDPWVRRAKERLTEYEGTLKTISKKEAREPKKVRRIQDHLPDRIHVITVAPLNFVDLDFKIAMEKLSELAGVAIESDEKALERAEMSRSMKVTLITAEYLPLADVLAILLAGTNLKYQVEENRIFISDQITG